jgi:DNA repair ATPase RecN
MAVTVRTSDTIKELKADARVKRLAKTFASTPIFQIDVEKLSEEIANTHKTRPIRRLDLREPKFLDTVIDANTNDQRVRSRYSEIIMECSRAIDKLDDLLDFVTQYLLTTYSMSLRGYRTKEERMYVINSVLRTYRKYKKALVTLREEARLIVEDIDKGGWSLERSIKAMQIHTHKEHILG